MLSRLVFLLISKCSDKLVMLLGLLKYVNMYIYFLSRHKSGNVYRAARNIYIYYIAIFQIQM